MGWGISRANYQAAAGMGSCGILFADPIPTVQLEPTARIFIPRGSRSACVIFVTPKGSSAVLAAILIAFIELPSYHHTTVTEASRDRHGDNG
jgi:hypothetical protein